jgi:hypothetical protein
MKAKKIWQRNGSENENSEISQRISWYRRHGISISASLEDFGYRK